MKTTVAINGAQFHAHHGYYPEERKSGNQFILHAEVELKSFDSNDDNIQDTINYEDLYNICKEEMQNTQKLLETVVFNIINRVKEELPNVFSCEVTLEKMSPQLGGKVKKAIVKMKY